MKWTTTVQLSDKAHWVGFKASERHAVPCGSRCKMLEGGRILHFEDSGVEHNPPPTTERGMRRSASRKK